MLNNKTAAAQLYEVLMQPQVIASNLQKPMADLLHCEGHIYSSMTDHSSL